MDKIEALVHIRNTLESLAQDIDGRQDFGTPTEMLIVEYIGEVIEWTEQAIYQEERNQ